MKKGKTILLLGLVVVIWATVIYRIVSSLEDEHASPDNFQVKTVHDDKPLQKEYSLSLSYQDPFLKELASGTEKTERKVYKKITTAPVPPVVINWERIKYFGIVSNPSRKKITGTFNIENSDVFLTESESFGEFKIIKLTRDSAEVETLNNRKYILKRRTE